MESQKMAIQQGADGGPDPAMYERGTNLALSPFTHGLVGYWTFDEGAGTTAADSSGWGNSGTLTNGPVWSSGGTCKASGCLTLDGTNDQVVVPTASSLNLMGNLTLAGWVNPNIPGSPPSVVYGLFSKGGGGSGVNYRTGIHFSDKHMDYTVFTGAAWVSVGSPTAFFPNSQWIHYAVSVNNGTAKLYKNGVLNTTGASAIGATLSEALYLGGSGDANSTYIPGVLDDMRVYNRALSAAEIAAIYSAGN
jgi:hypothetical protein